MKPIPSAVLALGAALLTASAQAKLPAPSEEAKAKAAEAAAKAGWTNKVADYQLCKVSDRIAAAYLAEAKKGGKDLKPVATPPCTDPGPFSYTPPEPRPIEAAGAHSPPKTAAEPPSTTVPAAVTTPAPKK